MAVVSIIGAGAVGLSLAESLSRAGVDTEVVVRNARFEDLKQRGLWAKRIARSVAPIRVSLSEVPSSKIWLMTPKTYALPQALEQYLPHAGADTSIVLFQNGISADETAKKIAPNVTLLGAIVTFNALSLRAGEVDVAAEEDERLSIGLGSEDDGLNRAIRHHPAYEALARGLDVHPIKSLSGARWSKLIVNLNNAIFAATRMPASRVYAHPYGPWLAVTAMREGLAVAKASKVRLAKIPWASPALLKLVASLPDAAALPLFKRQVERVLPSQMPTLGSTLQSLERGEPTEIDDLNGTIVRLAEHLGIPTPVNTVLTRAVKAQSRGEAACTIDQLCDQATQAQNSRAA